MNKVMLKQEEYRKIFSHLPDEFSQFNFLITKALADGGHIDKSLRLKKNLLKSCQSNLWFRLGLTPEKELFLDFDSDSVILKGLLLVIKDIWGGATINEIESSKFVLMKYVMIGDLLSTKRKNSIQLIMQKIKLFSKGKEGR